jgi:hypothetical protein
MRITRFLSTAGVAIAMLMPSMGFTADASIDASATQDASVHTSDFLGTFLQGNNMNGQNTVFDVRAFRSHPCYNAIGGEIDYCLTLLGVTGDFESMIEDSSINRMIVEHTINNRCNGLSETRHAACVEENTALLPQLLTELKTRPNDTLSDEDTDVDAVADATDDDDDDISEDTPQAFAMRRHQRAQSVWSFCKDHSNGQAGCFQGFIRLVNDDTVSLSTIEEMMGASAQGSSGDDDLDNPNDDDADASSNDDNDDDDSSSTRSSRSSSTSTNNSLDDAASDMSAGTSDINSNSSGY